MTAGSPLERFNGAAVMIEMNDRHRGDPRPARDLLAAIRVLAAEWTAPHSLPSGESVDEAVRQTN